MEFVDEVIKLYPKNINLKTGKTFLAMLRRANPKKVIVCWNDSVLKLYENEIHEDNYDFFEKKDYTQDLLRNGWGEQIESILKIIDEIKDEIKDESEDNKRKALKYMINLNKLCKIYFQ
tara:strand:+ start:2905 stop:3261 length:357 start_codon:yes stop_codon:yes gene_type:complete